MSDKIPQSKTLCVYRYSVAASPAEVRFRSMTLSTTKGWREARIELRACASQVELSATMLVMSSTM